MSSDGEQQVRLASIVSIDVAGFSSLSERDQARAARQVQALRGRIEGCAHRNGGRIFNTAGDGFMLEFPSAGAAFGCINELLDKRARGEPLIRVGAHIGDVVVTINNDLLGHGVNVAARLQSLAVPGSALVSGEFRSMARNSPQAAFLAKGRLPLDNIEEKVQTYAIIPQTQRLLRQARRIAAIAAVLALLVGAPFLYPRAMEMARAMGISNAINLSLPSLGQAGPAPANSPAAAAPAVAPPLVVEPAAAPETPTPSASPTP